MIATIVSKTKSTLLHLNIHDASPIAGRKSGFLPCKILSLGTRKVHNRENNIYCSFITHTVAVCDGWQVFRHRLNPNFQRMVRISYITFLCCWRISVNRLCAHQRRYITVKLSQLSLFRYALLELLAQYKQVMILSMVRGSIRYSGPRLERIKVWPLLS